MCTAVKGKARLQWDIIIYNNTYVFLRLPVSASGQLLVWQRLNLHPLELDIMTRDASSLHDASSALIVLTSEQVYTDRLQPVSVSETPENEAVALRLLLQCLGVQELALLLLEDKYGHAVVWGALLSVGREPGKDDLRVCGKLVERHVSRGRRNLDVASQEVAAVVETILGDVGNIGVDDSNRDVSLALVVSLDVESGRNLADTRVDEFTRLDSAVAKGEIDRDGGVDGGENIGSDIHLGDALNEEVALVLAPFLVGQKAVDGLVHVACN